MPRNIILLSGGPGLFDRADPEHDASWANYVTPILLQTQTAEQRRAFQAADEEVWWFIYRPAYERRWHDDVSRSDRAHEPRRIRTIRCGDHACTSYVDLLEWRARQRGWNLRWISRADEFWSRLATFSDPISRVYYWGHARENLWLTVEHNSAHAAIAPAAHEIITVASIASHSALSSKFQAASSARRHTFFGCNTHRFAQEWARVFNVNSRGYEGTLSFASVPTTGRPTPAAGCHQRDYAPGGAMESAIELVPELHSMEVLGAALRPAEEEAARVAADDRALTDFDADPGFELVALADEAILDGGGMRSSAELLQGLLSDAGEANSLGASGSPSPAALFDACTGASHAPRQAVEQQFDVLARPGEQLAEVLRPGDLYVRRALGEDRLAHLAVLSSGELVRERDLASAGLNAEGLMPGWYAEVVETGAVPHALEDRFARRVADESGRLPLDSALFRLWDFHADWMQETITGWDFETLKARMIELRQDTTETYQNLVRKYSKSPLPPGSGTNTAPYKVKAGRSQDGFRKLVAQLRRILKATKGGETWLEFRFNTPQGRQKIVTGVASIVYDRRAKTPDGDFLGDPAFMKIEGLGKTREAAADFAAIASKIYVGDSNGTPDQKFARALLSVMIENKLDAKISENKTGNIQTENLNKIAQLLAWYALEGVREPAALMHFLTLLEQVWQKRNNLTLKHGIDGLPFGFVGAQGALAGVRAELGLPPPPFRTKKLTEQEKKAGRERLRGTQKTRELVYSLERALLQRDQQGMKYFGDLFL